MLSRIVNYSVVKIACTMKTQGKTIEFHFKSIHTRFEYPKYTEKQKLN